MPAPVAFLVVVAGVFGLLIGSFLNVVAYRVPEGVSLLRESRCATCDSAIKPWHNIPVLGWLVLRGRCASCRAHISGRYPLVEAVTGITFAAVAWWAVGSTDLWLLSERQAWSLALLVVAFLYLAAVSIVLTLIDLDTRRLPNTIVLPSYIVALVLLGFVSALEGDWVPAMRAVIGMAALYAFYAILRVIRPGGMGGGDVKLAGVLGIYLGWCGWGALAVGSFAAFVLGGLFGIALIALRRAARKTAIPFGPWMIAGAWMGILAGDAIANWYVGLFTGE